jgi:hypothetical protein
VFGPVTARELLEMLYAGALTFDSPIAAEGKDFLPVARYEVFRAHESRVAEQRARAEEQLRRQRTERKARRMRQARWLAVALVTLAVGGWSVQAWVRHQRAAAAEATRIAREQALQAELARLNETVSIAPPLIPVAAPEPPPKSKRRRRRARRSGASAAAPAPTGPPSERDVYVKLGTLVPAFKRCIVAQIQRAPETVGGEIRLSFSIGNDGRATGVALADRFLRRSPLVPCLRGALGGVRWPAYEGEVRNVEYPIRIDRS